jgi:hypothetical protein
MPVTSRTPTRTARRPVVGSVRPASVDSYLAQTELVSRQVPWMLAMGNHELEALYAQDGYGGQRQRWFLPNDGPAQCPTAYSFGYGNTAFIALDANDVSYEIPAVKRLQRRRADGLAGTLAAGAEVLAGGGLHRVLPRLRVLHRDLARVGGGVRARWVPLFDKYQVDLVVIGHNHVYERTDPLGHGRTHRTAPPGATVDPATDGVTTLTVCVRWPTRGARSTG